MRRDSLFYRMFQQVPTLLFDIVEPPANATGYRFESVAVKEPRFEIDGVFLPPESASTPGVVYFCEVQFQKDQLLYERLFGELFLYFYRNRQRFSNWQAIVVYPNRNLEQSDVEPYRCLLATDQVHRIFLNELGDLRQLPLGVALMGLTTIEPEQSATEARQLINRARQEEIDTEARRSIIEIITSILAYRFPTLTRVEIEKMLDIDMKFEDTQLYRDIKQEARTQGTLQGTLNVVIRQLNRRFKQELSAEHEAQIAALSLPVLEALSEALLDFEGVEDLTGWLAQQEGEGVE